MKKLVFGLLVGVSLVLSVGCAFATVDISQTHWQLPDRGFSGGSRVYPVDTVLTYTDLSALRNSLNDSMQSRSAQLTYSGSFYFITMVRDGDIYWLCNGNGGRYRTAVESTDEPSSTVNNFNQTIINNSSGSASGSTGSPYVSSSWQEKELLGKIYEKLWFINEWLQITKDWVKEVNYNVKNVNTNINNNVVPALVAINKNLSSMLTDTVSRLSSIQSASWASVDAENRILSTLTGIGNQLGSVIRNGQIQVNTSPIEARLDKLISMYSKVNSVVLDTASVNGGQITGAVGGELKDVVFWGDTGMSSNEFLTPGSLWYRLGPNVGNTTPTTLDDSIVLRSVNLGSTIPSYIANDPVLYAGVWRKGTDYIISDTYNASTGEYVQRVDCVDLGSLSWSYISQGDNSRWFCSSLPAGFLEHDDISTPGPLNSPRLTNASYSSLFHHTSDVCYSHAYGREVLCFYSSYLDDASIDVSSRLSGFLLMYPRTPVVASYTPVTIAIPEGNSYISSYNVRITGKYETYDSYTQTADIITAINNIPPVDLDLTPLSSRLDTLNTTISSVISQGKLKVDNSAVVTALDKLDKLDELPTIKTAVDGVNTTISSVISQGKLKVDNSAVVAAIEGIQAGSAADLSPVISRLDTLINKTSDTVVNVVNNNTYITNVFQLDDDTSVVDTIKDGVGKVSGLFKWLWNNTFKGAFSHADISKLDGLL